MPPPPPPTPARRPESAGSLSFLGGLPPAGPLESLAEEAVLPQGAAAAAASAGLAGSSTEEGGGLDGEPSFSAPCWAGDSSFVVAPRSPGGEAGSAGTSAHSSPSRPGTALSDAPVAPLEGGLESTHYTLEFQALTDQQCQRELEAEMDGGGEPAPPPDPDMQPVLVGGQGAQGAGACRLRGAPLARRAGSAQRAVFAAEAPRRWVLPAAHSHAHTASHPLPPIARPLRRSLSWPAARCSSGAASWPTPRTSWWAAGACGWSRGVAHAAGRR